MEMPEQPQPSQLHNSLLLGPPVVVVPPILPTVINTTQVMNTTTSKKQQQNQRDAKTIPASSSSRAVAAASCTSTFIPNGTITTTCCSTTTCTARSNIDRDLTNATIADAPIIRNDRRNQDDNNACENAPVSSGGGDGGGCNTLTTPATVTITTSMACIQPAPMHGFGSVKSKERATTTTTTTPPLIDAVTIPNPPPFIVAAPAASTTTCDSGRGSSYSSSGTNSSVIQRRTTTTVRLAPQRYQPKPTASSKSTSTRPQATRAAAIPTATTAGRWTVEEHANFVHGLSLYGREWTRYHTIIPTRTPAQVRSHAQKYFITHKTTIVAAAAAPPVGGTTTSTDTRGGNLHSGTMTSTFATSPIGMQSLSSVESTHDTSTSRCCSNSNNVESQSVTSSLLWSPDENDEDQDHQQQKLQDLDDAEGEFRAMVQRLRARYLQLWNRQQQQQQSALYPIGTSNDSCDDKTMNVVQSSQHRHKNLLFVDNDDSNNTNHDDADHAELVALHALGLLRQHGGTFHNDSSHHPCTSRGSSSTCLSAAELTIANQSVNDDIDDRNNASVLVVRPLCETATRTTTSYAKRRRISE